MIDAGLLLSVAVIYAVVWASVRWVFPRAPDTDDALDAATTPAIVGLAAGRVVAVMIDDPNAFRRLGDLLIIRSGVEFWPGVAAGAAALVFSARRHGADPVARAAAVIPAGLMAYAAYAATCVVREGCFGPVSSVGLVPRIGGARQFPVEFVVAAVTAALAVMLSRVRWRSATVMASAAGGLALIRLVAGVWLPRVEPGWSRLEAQSVVVLLGAVSVGVWSVLRSGAAAAATRR